MASRALTAITAVQVAWSLMPRKTVVEPRLVAIAIIAVAILVGLELATGGGLTGSASPSSTVQPLAPLPTATSTPQGMVHGMVSVQSRHTAGHTWHFIYTVRDIGAIPIAGFEVNAPPSNLFHISGPSGWTFYGSGVCNGNHGGVLVYWSTTSAQRGVIAPGHAKQFSFDVNTSGTLPATYSLSWQLAQPSFGAVGGPAGSSLPAPVPCGH